jgi:hypothetical protein
MTPARDAGIPNAPLMGVGKEFLWIDQDITWNSAGAGLRVARQPPADWTTPVNYAGGTVQFRIDVKSKPTDTSLWLELCMWNNQIGSPEHNCYHCMNISKVGLSTCSTRANIGGFDLKKPLVALQHRLKLGPGRGADIIGTNNPALPITARYTIVLVPAGERFSGWDKYPAR